MLESMSFSPSLKISNFQNYISQNTHQHSNTTNMVRGQGYSTFITAFQIQTDTGVL